MSSTIAFTFSCFTVRLDRYFLPNLISSISPYWRTMPRFVKPQEIVGVIPFTGIITHVVSPHRKSCSSKIAPSAMNEGPTQPNPMCIPLYPNTTTLSVCYNSTLRSALKFCQCVVHATQGFRRTVCLPHTSNRTHKQRPFPTI